MRTKKKKIKQIDVYKFAYNFHKNLDEVVLGEPMLLINDERIVAKIMPYNDNKYLKDVKNKLKGVKIK